jgi:hypothetical protein
MKTNDKENKKCGEKCKECIICKGQPKCCHCDLANGYHACVTWQRGSKKENKK